MLALVARTARTSAARTGAPARFALAGGAAAATVGSVAFSSAATAPSNPLLDPPQLFPRYADIKPEHITAALSQRLNAAEDALSALEHSIEGSMAEGKTPSYHSLNDEAERISESVYAPWGAVSHLKSVKDSAALREAVEATEPAVVAFGTRFGQSRALYLGWKKLRDDAHAFSALTPTQQRVVELELRGMPGPGSGRIAEIQF